MVTTTSDASTAAVVRIFGCAAAMSMPTSRIASTAIGLIWSAGAEPAERTSIRPAARCDSQPAAIWERPALCTQTNRTLGLSGMCRLLGLEQASAPQADVDQGDQDGHLDERPDHPGQRLARGDAEDADRDRDGQFEVVARGGEGERGGPLVPETDHATGQERATEHEEEVREQGEGDAGHVAGPGSDRLALQREQDHDSEQQ